MRFRNIFRPAAFAVLLLLTALSPLTPATAQTSESPRRVIVQYYFFSADQDVDLTAGSIMGLAAFEKMLHQPAGKDSEKFHVWATGRQEISLGETFSSKTGEPYKTEESEVVEIGTGAFGEDGKVIAVAINAHKGRWNDRRTLYDRWDAKTNTTMPINGVLLVGGQSGDPLLGKPAKKKLKPQLLYFAVSVHAVD